MQGGTTGAGQNADAADGQGAFANSDTLAGYGKPSDNRQDTDDTLAGDGQNTDEALAGDGQNTDEALAGDGQNTDEALADDGQSADTAAQSASSFTDEKLASVLAQIQSLLPVSNGDWSVYVCDLKTGAEGSINDHRMQAASLIKLYIMGAVYENYDALIAQYGQDTIDANLYFMITVSDNDAANALTTYLGSGDSSAGMQIVNNYCLAHGYTTSSMGRLLLHSNESGDNYTSVENCGKLLKMVYWDGYRKESPENAGTAEETAKPEPQNETQTENADAPQNDANEEVTEAPETNTNETSADNTAESENLMSEASSETGTQENSESGTENADAQTTEESAEATASVSEDTSASSNTTALTPHASDMFSLLCAQTRRHKIPAQLPDGVHTANKTGELDDVENDAAILYDTDNDLIIVFMSEHLGDCGAAQSTIASLSRQIYDAYR